MNKKNVLSVIVTLGLVLSISNTVLEPSSEMSKLLNQKAKEQQQISNDQKDLSKRESQSRSLGTKIEMMDS